MAVPGVRKFLRLTTDFAVVFALNLYSYLYALRSMAGFPRWFCQFLINFYDAFIKIWLTRL